MIQRLSERAAPGCHAEPDIVVVVELMLTLFFKVFYFKTNICKVTHFTLFSQTDDSKDFHPEPLP